MVNCGSRCGVVLRVSGVLADGLLGLGASAGARSSGLWKSTPLEGCRARQGDLEILVCLDDGVISAAYCFLSVNTIAYLFVRLTDIRLRLDKVFERALGSESEVSRMR